MDVLEHPVRQQLTQQLGRPGIGGECKLTPVAHGIGKRRWACVTEQAFGKFRIPHEIRKRLELARPGGNHPVPGVLDGLGGHLSFVMPGLVPGIHVFPWSQDVDGRDEPGHDEQLN
jgi:hypothetical protein